MECDLCTIDALIGHPARIGELNARRIQVEEKHVSDSKKGKRSKIDGKGKEIYRKYKGKRL